MKSLLRGIAINSFALWATSQVISGLVIKGGLDVVLLGGVGLTLINLLLKPILSLLTLPLTLMTMGLFSWVINVVLIYVLTIFIPQIAITSYTFPGLSAQGFSLPKITFSPFQSTIVVALSISLIVSFLNWLFRR